MKIYFPILFVFFFLFSCDKKNAFISQKDSISDSISNYLKTANDPNCALDKKLVYFDKAYYLAGKAKNDTLLFRILCNQMYYFPEQSSKCIQLLKPIISRSKINKHKAYFAGILAEDYLQKNQNDSAFYQFNQSKILYEHENDSLRTGYNLLKIAQIQQSFNDFYESEKTLTEALLFLEKTKEKTYLSEVYNMLGIAYNNLEAFDIALDFYNKAEQISTDAVARQVFENNKAVIHLRSKNYLKAIEILQKLKISDVSDKNLFLKTMIYHNLGVAQFKNNNKSGLTLMESALEMAKKDHNEKEIVSIYSDLSDCFSKINKNKAIEYAQLGYEKATELNAIDYRIEILKNLVRLTDGNLSKTFAIQNIQLSDSIFKVRQLSKNQFAKIKYDSKIANKENTKLKIEKKLNTQLYQDRMFFSAIIFGLFLLLCILLYFVIKLKHKRENLKISYDTETRIAKKVHDELANDVYNVMTFAITQDLNNEEKKEKLIASIDKVYLRTRDISRENNSIETGIEFSNYLKTMLSEYNNENLRVITKAIDAVDWNLMQENKKIVVFRVLQELMINMKKHSQATICVIGFEITEKRLQINYADNGVGARVDEIILKSGLQNVENRILAINGKITFDNNSQKGFKINFNFPL